MSLASLANKVEGAGRGPDKNLVHMSPAELDYLREAWGPPTINPTTGLPEYGWFDSILQYAPAVLSAFGGGGSGGLASGLGSMLGAEGPWSSILGSAIIGGAGSALMGGGVKGALTGALLGGGLSALSPVIGNALGGSDIGNFFGISDSARDTVFGDGVGRMGVDSVSGAPSDMLGQLFSGDSGARVDSYAADPAFSRASAGLANAATAAGAGGAGAGGGSSSSLMKFALPLMAAAALGGGGGSRQPQGSAAPAPSGGGKLPDLNLSLRPKDTSGIDWYTYGQRPRGASFFDPQWTDAEGRVMARDGGQIQGYAEGGALAKLPSRYFADGPGSGRDDLIEARLSPGEGVIDAETLALLGDGNPDEGWRKVDQMRANVRKHKGGALAKGKISPNAKRPEQYMRKGGGR